LLRKRSKLGHQKHVEGISDFFSEPALDLTKRVSDKIKKGSDAVGQRWLAGGWLGGWIHQQRARCALVIYGLVFRAQCFYSSFNTQWDAHRFSFFFSPLQFKTAAVMFTGSDLGGLINLAVSECVCVCVPPPPPPPAQPGSFSPTNQP
jgi:hypothetical protein